MEPVVGGEEPEPEVLEMSEAEAAHLAEQQASAATHQQQQVSRSIQPLTHLRTEEFVLCGLIKDTGRCY